MFGLTSVLNARGICARIHVEAIVDERHDLGAALVAFGELVARILRQRLHPLADGALRVADLLQDRVHLRRAAAAARCGPVSWTSSGDIVVVVDALSAQR